MERATDSFVVWVDGGGAPETGEGALAGRVEHVQSADRATFATAQELLAFVLAHRQSPGGAGSP
jgi:hypothetical protein